MADQAKLHNPIHLIFQSVGCVARGQALSSGRIRPFLFTNASCRCCSFRCISLICRAYSSDVMVSPGFKKLQWIRLAADYQTDHDPPPPFFLVQAWFGEVLWSLFSILIEIGIMLSSKSHFSSHVPIQSRNGSVLLHRIREDNT